MNFVVLERWGHRINTQTVVINAGKTLQPAPGPARREKFFKLSPGFSSSPPEYQRGAMVPRSSIGGFILEQVGESSSSPPLGGYYRDIKHHRR